MKFRLHLSPKGCSHVLLQKLQTYSFHIRLLSQPQLHLVSDAHYRLRLYCKNAHSADTGGGVEAAKRGRRNWMGWSNSIPPRGRGH